MTLVVFGLAHTHTVFGVSNSYGCNAIRDLCVGCWALMDPVACLLISITAKAPPTFASEECYGMETQAIVYSNYA